MSEVFSRSIQQRLEAQVGPRLYTRAELDQAVEDAKDAARSEIASLEMNYKTILESRREQIAPNPSCPRGHAMLFAEEVPCNDSECPTDCKKVRCRMCDELTAADHRGWDRAWIMMRDALMDDGPYDSNNICDVVIRKYMLRATEKAKYLGMAEAWDKAIKRIELTIETEEIKPCATLVILKMLAASYRGWATEARAKADAL